MAATGTRDENDVPQELTPGGFVFLSYSHADADYVRRLSGHLVGHGVPVWFDEHLVVGSRFVQEIRDRIREASAVVVVMSEAAEDTPWVEREVLEAQRHNQPLVPILRSGPRHLLLAELIHFDARRGALPDSRLVEQLRQLVVGPPAGPGPRPGLAPRPETASRVVLVSSGPSPPVERRSVDDLLATMAGFLDDGDLVHADLVTTTILLTAYERTGVGWIRPDKRLAIPASVLAEVDALWARASGGSLGLLHQLALHGGPPGGAPAGSGRDFAALASAVGWRPAGTDRSRSDPLYSAFVAGGGASPPPGFFPTYRNPKLEVHEGWHDRWSHTAMAIHLHLRSQLRSHRQGGGPG